MWATAVGGLFAACVATGLAAMTPGMSVNRQRILWVVAIVFLGASIVLFAYPAVEKNNLSQAVQSPQTSNAIGSIYNSGNMTLNQGNSTHNDSSTQIPIDRDDPQGQYKLVEDYDKFPQAGRTLLELKEMTKGQTGLIVVEMIKPYLGTVVGQSGTIMFLNPGTDGGVAADIAVNGQVFGCKFNKKWHDELARLRSGDKITFKGILNGINLSSISYLNACGIVHAP